GEIDDFIEAYLRSRVGQDAAQGTRAAPRDRRLPPRRLVRASRRLARAPRDVREQVPDVHGVLPRRDELASDPEGHAVVPRERPTDAGVGRRPDRAGPWHGAG